MNARKFALPLALALALAAFIVAPGLNTPAARAQGKKYRWFVQACNPPFGCAKSAVRFFTVQ